MPRHTLTNLLLGHDVDFSGPAFPPPTVQLACASKQGVLGLVAQRRMQFRNGPQEFMEALLVGERSLAATAMLRGAECRRVLAALPAELSVLLLNGSVLAY